MMFAFLFSLAINVADVTVDPSADLGPIRPIHGVNNGPTCKGPFANLNTFKAAGIPSVRNHDASLSSEYGGQHTVDISAVFPDFDRDENDPSAYDFAFTDYCVDNVRRAGSEVYYRLGQSIEHGIKKYHIYPPKDFHKWARVCEHVIRHFNEGWANGHHWNIRYWEIWNEASNNATNNPTCWGGTDEQFFDFFAVAAKHLKKTFPDLMIGGPATTGWEEWSGRFLAAARKRDVPLDFFSWHGYGTTVTDMVERAHVMRGFMNSNGYERAENHMTEWNYVRNWDTERMYTQRVEMGDRLEKGTAYRMAMMIALQTDTDVALAHYYDARRGTMNGMFCGVTRLPMKGYYPFYAWSKMVKLGRQVRVSASNANALFVTAARGTDGRIGILLCRYTYDNNVVAAEDYVIRRADGKPFGEAIGHLTDFARTYTEVPVERVKDGALRIQLYPDSFVFIEIEK